MRREVWYDVTEYECWLCPAGRRHRSPLELLSFLTNSEVETTNARKFFEWPVFLTWSFIKFRMNRPLLLLWFIWRVFVTATLYLVNPVLFPTNETVTFNENNTIKCEDMPKASLAVSAMMVVYAIFIILMDCIECFLYIKRKRVKFTKDDLFKDYATHHGFYRLVFTIQSQSMRDIIPRIYVKIVLLNLFMMYF